MEKKNIYGIALANVIKIIFCTERYDGFLVALLPLAMQIGEDIEIEGSVSEQLLYNISNYFMKILTLAVPFVKDYKYQRWRVG